MSFLSSRALMYVQYVLALMFASQSFVVTAEYFDLNGHPVPKWEQNQLLARRLHQSWQTGSNSIPWFDNREEKPDSFSDEEEPQPKQVAPAVPFPTFGYPPPQTSFSCSNVRQAGFYADPETRCQVIRRCTLDNFMFTFVCPNMTVFSQVLQTCDYWYNVKCSSTLQQLDVPSKQTVAQSVPSQTLSDASNELWDTNQTPPGSRWSFASDEPLQNPTDFDQKQPTLNTVKASLSEGTSVGTVMQWVGQNPDFPATAKENNWFMAHPSSQLGNSAVYDSNEDFKIKNSKISVDVPLPHLESLKQTNNNEFQSLRENALMLPTNTNGNIPIVSTIRRRNKDGHGFNAKKNLVITTTARTFVAPEMHQLNSNTDFGQDKHRGTEWMPLTQFL